jgi:hypothetical protein
MFYHAAKPVYLARVAPATQVSLPARVLDVQAICLKCLPSDRLILRLADVLGLPWFREVAVPGPMAQQETKTRPIVHGFSGSGSVICISGGSGIRDCHSHPLEKGQECNSVEVHGEAASLGDALPG